MRNHKFTAAAAVSVFVLLLTSAPSRARMAVHRDISIGGVFGDPSGITLRYPLGISRAIDAGFGPDYFGSPRLQLDYIWQFHIFSSPVFGGYIGPGLAVAFAKGINSFYTREPMKETFAAQEDNRFEVGGRAVLGVNVTPKSFPFEFFFETAPLIPISRTFDLDFDGAIGFRYKL